MMTSFQVLFYKCVLFHVIKCSSKSDVDWFKQTSIHTDNIMQIENGWSNCDKWAWPIVPTTPADFTVQCITLKVPLDWNQPFNNTNASVNSTIDYYILHVFGEHNMNNSGNNGAFWMINGGPGNSGVGFYPHAIPWLQYINSSLDVYIPDHRGTGHSNIVKCPDYLANLPSNCTAYARTKYADNTHYFSTYAASMDLGYAIDLFANNMNVYPDNNTIIYGASYGTYYLNVYLQIFPNQSNGVIFEGICPPDKCRQFDYDWNHQHTGLQWIDICDKDNFCGIQRFKNILNKTAYDVINEIFTSDIVPCFNISKYINNTDVTPLDRLGRFFASVVEDFEAGISKISIPVMLFRMNRCNGKDAIALEHAWSYIFDNTYQKKEIYSWYVNDFLFKNIILSEMWYGLNPNDSGETYDEMLLQENTYYFSTGDAADTRRWWDDWNKYVPNKDFHNKYADPPIPMLLLNGDVDPQTPWKWAQHAAQQYNASNSSYSNSQQRYFYTFPGYSHWLLLKAPECTHSVMWSFIQPDTQFVPNITCINQLAPVDFSGNQLPTEFKDTAFKLFNTYDLWQVNVTISPTKQPSMTPTTKRPTVVTEKPTSATTISPTVDELWFIVGIVFICLFVVSLIIIAYLGYLLYSRDNKYDGYDKTEETLIEAGNIGDTTGITVDDD